MASASFVKEVTRMCPVTNLYECSDGKFVLVTVKAPELMPVPPEEALGGIPIVIDASQVPQGVEVFLSDSRGRVLDVDGNAANGMTPLAVLSSDVDFVGALLAVGYELEGS